MAEKYEISAEAAATYDYMASQTGKKVKDLTKTVKEGSEEFAKWNQIAYASGWTIGDSAASAVSLAHALQGSQGRAAWAVDPTRAGCRARGRRVHQAVHRSGPSRDLMGSEQTRN